jgi:hypothetical protein
MESDYRTYKSPPLDSNPETDESSQSTAPLPISLKTPLNFPIYAQVVHAVILVVVFLVTFL